jgi:two-component system response regulator GlrR
MNPLNALIVHFANDELSETLRFILDNKDYVRYISLYVNERLNPEKTLRSEFSKQDFDLLIFTFSGGQTALAEKLLRSVSAAKNGKPILICVGNVRSEKVLEFLALGVSDVVLAPLKDEDIILRLSRLGRISGQCDDLIQKSTERIALRRIIGTSPAFIDEINKLPLIAKCDVCVLITGETGTGKEVVARTIHYLSSRPDKPFVPVNCGAIPKDLIENELFGHEKGAFTGAVDSHAGLINEADGGTLFLDEIDSLPLMAQVKLLRFLQDKEFRPLGSVKTRKADVRIIAASNHDLEELVQNEKIRFDLYYRLNVMQIALPPLRERPEDVRPLARHFLERYSEEFRRPVVSIDPDALLMLQSNYWQGNVRELENVIERAVLLCGSDTITVSDIRIAGSPKQRLQESLRSAKARVVAEFESAYLKNILEIYRGNITRSARAAGKNRRAFFQLIRKYQINVERFKS